MKKLIAIVFLAVGCFAQSSAPPAAANQLLGTWRLVSEEITLKDGTVKPDPTMGPHAIGYLLYEPDGHMCAAIMNPDRPAWKNPNKPVDEEKITAFDGFIAYCGTYKLDAAASTVTHYPDVAWTPTWVGSTQPRPFRIEGQRLIITPAVTDPKLTKRVLTWQRAQ
jgi:hypothetical protein